MKATLIIQMLCNRDRHSLCFTVIGYTHGESGLHFRFLDCNTCHSFIYAKYRAMASGSVIKKRPEQYVTTE